MMLLPKQLRTFPQPMQQPGQWAAHLIRGVDIYLLHATLAPRPSRKFIKGIRQQNRKPTGKEGHNPDRGKEKKEGGKERRKEGGRQEERNEGQLQNAACTFPCTHVTFKELQVPSNLQTLVSKCGKDRAVYRCQPQHTANTMPRCAICR